MTRLLILSICLGMVGMAGIAASSYGMYLTYQAVTYELDIDTAQNDCIALLVESGVERRNIRKIVSNNQGSCMRISNP